MVAELGGGEQGGKTERMYYSELEKDNDEAEQSPEKGPVEQTGGRREERTKEEGNMMKKAERREKEGEREPQPTKMWRREEDWKAHGGEETDGGETATTIKRSQEK